VIYNLGSHIIDQIYVLFGMPEKVGCRFTDVRKVGVDEGVRRNSSQVSIADSSS
jgi:hypothetical protein